jgi:hypothetical protein
MLMVIVALTVTAVLTGAILGGREHAPMIGANATKLSKAKWGAEGAANVAVAAMGQIADMMDTLADPAVPLEDLQIGDAHVKVMLTDLEGNPPEDDDRELIMWAYAEIDGMIREVKKRISIRKGGSAADGLDLELKDFAIFAKERIDITTDHGSIEPWRLSPEAGTSRPIKVGVGYTSNSNSYVDVGADVGHIAFRVDDNANNAVINWLSSRNPGLFFEIPLDIPVIPEAPAPALSGLLGGGGDATVNLGENVQILPGAHGVLDVREGGTAVLMAGAGASFGFEDLRVDGLLVVTGHAEIIVEDRVDLDHDGSIALDDGATLRLHVLAEVHLHGGSSLGVHVDDAGKMPGELSHYVDPQRVRLYQPGPLHGGSGSQRVHLDHDSTMIACVHAPLSNVEINNGSALIGRATGARVQVKDASHLWYCPTLDSGLGFATAKGPLYDPDTGDPIAGLEGALASIDGIDGTLADLYAIMYAGWTPPGGESGGSVDVRDLPGDAIPEDDGGFTLVSPLGEASIGD